MYNTCIICLCLIGMFLLSKNDLLTGNSSSYELTYVCMYMYMYMCMYACTPVSYIVSTCVHVKVAPQPLELHVHNLV